MLAAEPHDLARHEHQLTPEQVVGGHAVFEAVHAARILRHIAADRAGDLRGGIGRIVKAGVFDRLRDGEIGHTRFDDGEAVSEIDLADTIELGHAEKHAIGKGQRAARKRGTGPPRHHLDPLGVAKCKDPAYLLRGLRQNDDHGQLTIGGQSVRLIGPHLPLGRDHSLTRHNVAKRRHDALATGEHGLVRQGHRYRHAGAPFWHARASIVTPLVTPCLQQRRLKRLCSDEAARASGQPEPLSLWDVDSASY